MKKTINVTIAYAEPLVQSIVAPLDLYNHWIIHGTTIFESSLCYSASAIVLRWGHIIWVKGSAMLEQDSCRIHHLFDSTFGHTTSTIVIYINIARIFHQNVI